MNKLKKVALSAAAALALVFGGASVPAGAAVCNTVPVQTWNLSYGYGDWRILGHVWEYKSTTSGCPYVWADAPVGDSAYIGLGIHVYSHDTTSGRGTGTVYTPTLQESFGGVHYGFYTWVNYYPSGAGTTAIPLVEWH